MNAIDLASASTTTIGYQSIFNYGFRYNNWVSKLFSLWHLDTVSSIRALKVVALRYHSLFNCGIIHNEWPSIEGCGITTQHSISEHERQYRLMKTSPDVKCYYGNA